MRKRLICATLTLAVLFIGGCSKSDKNAKSTGEAKYNTVMDKGIVNKENAGTPSSNTADVAKRSEVQVQKKIIQTGDIRIIVEDLRETSTDIRRKIDEFGGYVESENLAEVFSNSRVRVPSDKLQAFIEYMEKNYDVQGKNFSTQDITDAYVDNDARIRNLKAQEAQILEIMKKANTVEEVLKVQNELSRVRGEIESLESRKKVWDRDVDFSTVMVNASKKHTAIESKLRALSASEFGKSIGKGFMKSTTALILFLQNVVIFVISNIILLVVIGVAAFFSYKKYIKGKS